MPRFPLLSCVEVSVPGRRATFGGTVTNLSRTGISLRIRQRLKPNRKITIRFHFLSDDWREVTEALDARVIWQSGDSAGLAFQSPLTAGSPDRPAARQKTPHLVESVERVEYLVKGEWYRWGVEGGPMEKIARTNLTMRVLSVLVVVATLSVCQAQAVWAAEKVNEANLASEIGLGASSFVLSVPYGAAKVSTAIVGGVVGGLAYLFSGFDKQVADSVWHMTIEGDYVITPDHLKGKKALRFSGVPPENHRVEGRKE